MDEQELTDSVDTPSEENEEIQETQEATDESETPKTIADEVADSLDTFVEEEEETSEPLTEDTAVEITDEGEADSSDVDDLLEGIGEHKTGLEKRVDKLTAKVYEKDDEIAQLRKENEALKTRTDLDNLGEIKPPKYTDEDLDRAFQNLSDDYDKSGSMDFRLLQDIIKARESNLEYKLYSRYEQEQTRNQQQAKQNKQEWASVVETYDYLADPNEPELYVGAKQELNINDPNSALFIVAKAIYEDPTPSAVQKYRKQGGMQIAVADALKRILSKRKGRIAEGKDGAKLKRRLAKTKVKNSIGPTSAQKAENNATPKKPKTQKDEFSEYMSDRKGHRKKTIGE